MNLTKDFAVTWMGSKRERRPSGPVRWLIKFIPRHVDDRSPYISSIKRHVRSFEQKQVLTKKTCQNARVDSSNTPPLRREFEITRPCSVIIPSCRITPLTLTLTTSSRMIPHARLFPYCLSIKRNVFNVDMQ